MRLFILIFLLIATIGQAAVTTGPSSSSSTLVAITGGNATNLTVNSLTNSGLISFSQLSTNTASSTTHSLLFAEAGDIKSRSTNGELRYLSSHPATGSRLLSQGGVHFAGAASTDRAYSTLTGLAPTTNSLSLRAVFRVTTDSGAAIKKIVGLTAANTGGSAGGSLVLYTYSTSLYAEFGGSNYRNIAFANFVPWYAGKVVEVIVVKDSDASTATMYINGVAVTTSAGSGGTPPAWNDYTTNNFLVVSGTAYQQEVYAATVFNYALSASQVLDVARYGIPYADKWGSTNNLIDLTTLNGGFETAGGGGADVFSNWVENNTAGSYITNVASPVYSGSMAAAVISDSLSSASSLSQSSLLATGKRYKMAMWASSAAASGTLRWGENSGGIPNTATLTTNWALFTTNVIANSAQVIVIRNAASQTNYVDEVTYTRLGAVVDLDFQNPSIEDLLIKDRSTNYFDATLVGGITRSTDVPSLTAATNVIIGASYLGTDGAEVLAQRNGTAAQEFRLYKTWANTGTDYERFSAKATTSNFLFLAAAGGTGTQRPISFANLGGTVNSYNQVVISTNGLVGIGTNSPTHALHVEGGFKLADGTQSAGYVLTTDANGVGTWQAAGSVTATNAIPFSGGNGTNLTLYPSSTANIALTVRSLTSQNSSMMEFIDSGSTTRHLITTNQLSIKGTVKIVDGTEGAGKVLKSDANGASYWGLVDDTNMLSTADAMIQTITFVIDGGGSAITTGIKGDLEIPYNCTINRVTMLADQSGSIVVDIWKDTYANYPATDADSITASAVPTITAATKSQDGTLTGWTTSVTAGDILRFNVDSASTVTRVTISLKVTKN